jgi:hypothetical protein
LETWSENHKPLEYSRNWLAFDTGLGLICDWVIIWLMIFVF